MYGRSTAAPQLGKIDPQPRKPEFAVALLPEAVSLVVNCILPSHGFQPQRINRKSPVINTCRTASKQRTLTISRINTCAKRGGGVSNVAQGGVPGPSGFLSSGKPKGSKDCRPES